MQTRSLRPNSAPPPPASCLIALLGTCLLLAGACSDPGASAGADGGTGPAPRTPGQYDECGNGIDEDACVSDDAGAGVCEPAAETCDGSDEDCDGVVDNGACTACACERWSGQTGALSFAQRPRHGVRSRAVETAFDGEDTVGFLYSVVEIGVDAEIMFELHRVDGSTLATHSITTVSAISGGLLAPAQNAISGTVSFGGERFVATWGQGMIEPETASVHAIAFAPDGTIVAGPSEIAAAGASIAGVAMLGEEAYVTFFRGGSTYVQRADASLSPLGAPIEIPGIGSSIFGLEVRRLGDSVAIIGAGSPGTTIRAALIRAGNLIGVADLGSISPDERGVYRASGASDGSGGALVCYQLEGWTLSCRRISLADASTDGPAFDVIPITGPGQHISRAWDVVAAGCAYQVVIGHSTGSGSQSVYRVYEIGTDNSISSTHLDAQWSQSNQSFAAYETHAGGLLRVHEAKMITLQSCAPAMAEPDCATLEERAIEAACGGCNADADSCRITRGDGRGSGRPRDGFEPFDCDRIDMVACSEALDAPTMCRESDGGSWLIPADCALQPE